MHGVYLCVFWIGPRQRKLSFLFSNAANIKFSLIRSVLVFVINISKVSVENIWLAFQVRMSRDRFDWGFTMH